jgi:hypothetical protein
VRLVAATLPGFGRTPAPDDVTVENYGRLAADLAASLGADVVAGHSLGANVALEMALRGGCSGPFVLLSPSFCRRDESIFPRALDRLGSVLGHLPFSLMFRIIGPAMRGSLPPDQADDVVAELGNNDPRFVRRQTRAYLQYLDGHPALAGDLATSGRSTTVIFGEKDDVKIQPGGTCGPRRLTLSESRHHFWKPATSLPSRGRGGSPNSLSRRSAPANGSCERQAARGAGTTLSGTQESLTRRPQISWRMPAPASAPKIDTAVSAFLARPDLGSRNRRRRWQEDLMGGVEDDLRFDVNAGLCHRRRQAVLPEGAEGFLALPGVNVVVVLALPPREVAKTTVGMPLQPPAGGPDRVVLFPRDTLEHDLSDNCHLELLKSRDVILGPRCASDESMLFQPGPLRCGIGRHAELAGHIRQIVWASSVNAAAIRNAWRASTSRLAETDTSITGPCWSTDVNPDGKPDPRHERAASSAGQ